MSESQEKQLTSAKNYLKHLKTIDFKEVATALWVVHHSYRVKTKTYSYRVRRVNTDPKIGSRLQAILNSHIENAGDIHPYDFETADQDQKVLVHSVKGTDFTEIIGIVKKGLEIELIKNLDELANAWAILLVAYPDGDEPVVAFQRMIGGWNLKKLNTGINAIWQQGKLAELEGAVVLRLSRRIDFIGYHDQILILDKANFERGLNFREGMKAKRDNLLSNMHASNLFENVEVLKKCGDDLTFLRKFNNIEKAGYYKEDGFLKILQKVAKKEGWKEFQFSKGKLLLTDENFEDVLSVLADRRMRSMLKREVYDVEGSLKRIVPRILGAS